MKLSKRFRKKKAEENDQMREYYYRTEYGGLIFTIRSDVPFMDEIYRILDGAYVPVRMGHSPEEVAQNVLDSLRWRSKIMAAKVDVDGKECKIRLSSDPREFIGW